LSASGVGEQLGELVEVDAGLGAVEAAALAFVDERVAERGARVGRQVPEPSPCLLGVLRGP
jgi:hypothetical protein